MMTNPASTPATPSTPATTSAPHPPDRRPLPWLLIIGLASLALLWPLTSLWGLAEGPARALTLLALTGAVWIGVVGLGRVPRPVLTLTLTAILHGILTVLLGVFVAGSGPAPEPARLWILLPVLVRDAGIGALLGLVALGVQKSLGGQNALGGRKSLGPRAGGERDRGTS